MKNFKAIAINLLSEDSYSIPYRPALNKRIGNPAAVILLQQIIYRMGSKHNRVDRFYKFKEPCKHPKYKQGDSWIEELGFSAKVFTKALDDIGFKRGAATRRLIAKEMGKELHDQAVKNEAKRKEKEALVVYYTDNDRLTWYTLNWDALSNLLLVCYSEEENKSDSMTRLNGELPFKTEKTSKKTANKTTEENPLNSLPGGKGTSSFSFSPEKPYPSIPENAASTAADPAGGAPTTEPQSPGETLSPDPLMETGPSNSHSPGDTSAPEESSDVTVDGDGSQIDFKQVLSFTPEELDAEREKVTALKGGHRDQQAEALRQTKFYLVICAILQRSVTPTEMIPLLAPLRNGTIPAGNLLIAAKDALLSGYAVLTNIPDVIRVLKGNDGGQYLADCQTRLYEHLRIPQEHFHNLNPDADLGKALEYLRALFGSVIVDGYDSEFAASVKEKCEATREKQLKYFIAAFQFADFDWTQEPKRSFREVWKWTGSDYPHLWEELRLAVFLKAGLVPENNEISKQLILSSIDKVSRYPFVRQTFEAIETNHPLLARILGGSAA